jgi:dihydrodipicolinate synthase/N-acetylneuraminate lyase
MKVTYRVQDPNIGRIFPNYVFRFRPDEIKTVLCARIAKCGNLMQLYNYSGYTMFSLAEEDIISIEP